MKTILEQTAQCRTPRTSQYSASLLDLDNWNTVAALQTLGRSQQLLEEHYYLAHSRNMVIAVAFQL